MKRISMFLFVVLMLVILSGCAGPNTQTNVPVSYGIAGFWNGLWHGMTLPISFIGSLMDSTIGVYEIHNNGGWYDFGFVTGVGGLAGGGFKIKFCSKD